jgi:uncharacterized repeat protein (TIGR01451 family)
MKLLNKIRVLGRKTKLAVVIVAIGLIAAPAVQGEFYPNRPTFDYNKTNGTADCNDASNPAAQNGRCGSMNGPVFNSFINTPSYGDERSFVDARRSDQTATGSYKNVLADVTKGSKEVVVRMYIHNNANTSTNASGLGVAKNTKVRLALPTNDGDALRAVGYISADNATPKVVEDTVDFTSTEKFSVAYKPGSAIIYNNGPLNGKPISDTVVTTGAPIGHDQLNGNFPGCFEFEAVVQVTLTVTPKGQPDLDLTKQVRKPVAGQTGGWTTEVNAKPGEQVEWLLNTKNGGQASMTDVVTRDVLPPHVKLVPGSVKFVNAKGSQALSDGPLFQSGYNAGRYDANDNTLITFKTTVLDDFKECQVRIRNVAYAHSKEVPADIRDDADVVITKENCKPTTPVTPTYSCVLLKTELGTTNRTTKFTTTAAASGGATIKQYVYDFGDGETLTTDKGTVEHTYKADGQYAARVKVQFAIGNQTVEAEGNNCAAAVTYKTPATPVTTTPTTPDSPKELPETGPAGVAAAIASVTGISTAAYYLITRRRAQV